MEWYVGKASNTRKVNLLTHTRDCIRLTIAFNRRKPYYWLTCAHGRRDGEMM